MHTLSCCNSKNASSTKPYTNVYISEYDSYFIIVLYRVAYKSTPCLVSKYQFICTGSILIDKICIWMNGKYIFNKTTYSHLRRRWYSGEHSCLPSSWPGFDSRPTHLTFLLILLHWNVLNDNLFLPLFKRIVIKIEFYRVLN